MLHRFIPSGAGSKSYFCFGIFKHFLILKWRIYIYKNKEFLYIYCLYVTPSHYHHCVIWNYDMPVRYILSSVWERLSIFSHLSIQYMVLCDFSLLISLMMIEIIYNILCLIIIIKSEVWTYSHCLGLGNETMLHVVCLSIFFGILGKERQVYSA